MKTARQKIGALSREDFAAIVLKSSSFNDLYRHLGFGDNGSLRGVILEKIKDLNIDISHFGRKKEDCPEYVEKVKECIKNSRSIFEVIRLLGERSTGSGHQKIRRIVKKNNIDISHLKGRGWNGNNIKKPLEDILKYGSNIESSHLKKRLLKEDKINNECNRCGISEWQGEHLSLILDHINGDHLDNRIENLQLLCPNCNSLTDTFGGRNIGRVGKLAKPLHSK